MIDPAGGPGLAREAPQGLGAGGQLRREDLDGHGAMEGEVEGLEHQAHPAPAKHAEDLVLPDLAEGRGIVGRGEEAEVRGVIVLLFGRRARHGPGLPERHSTVRPSGPGSKGRGLPWSGLPQQAFHGSPTRLAVEQMQPDMLGPCRVEAAGKVGV